MADANFADLFFHLVNAAEFDSCASLRFVRQHACANVFAGEHCEAGTNFCIEVPIHMTRREEVAQDAFEFDEERHMEHLFANMGPKPIRTAGRPWDPGAWRGARACNRRRAQ